MISRSSSSTSPRSRTAARRRRGGTARRHRVVALCLLALAAAGAPAPAAEPCTPIAARAVLTGPQAGDLYLRGAAATCDTIALDVVGRGLEGAFTLAFDVRFPTALITYDGYTPGALLEQGSPHMAPLYLVRVAGPGVITVSMTRFAPDPGVGASADAAIVTLRFKRVAAGSGAVDFDLTPASATADQILGADGAARAARFGPGHGVTITVP